VGIPVNTDGRVRSSGENLVEAFFAAGETSCVSVHGANRLGSNSLLECVVYGRRTGAAIAEYVQNRKLPNVDEQHYLKEAQQQVQGLLEQQGEYRIQEIRGSFQETMTEYCGVFRTQEIMEEGWQIIQRLQEKLSRIYLDDKGSCWNTEVVEALEMKSLMVVGKIILASALNRQESRGAHFREDFPQRDDSKFLRHTMAYYSPAGIDIDYRPVAISMFQPQERKY
jgi:succinate dehydrogenase / fumarate reductase, flavoprotein subunit